ncbi:MAG: major capsid protein [Bacilli bacterium]
MPQISTSLKYHYDEELFNNKWASEKDPTTLALLESGAMVEDATIAGMIANGGNYFTIPFYKDLTGEEQNYDGATNIVSTDTEDGVQSGVVYGRDKGFKNTIFVNDFTKADPMSNIIARINKFFGKKKQKRLIAITEAILGLTSTEFPEWANHKTNIAVATAVTPTVENKMGLTTLRDSATKAVGDNVDIFRLAIMHSKVANDLSQFNVLEYFKLNDTRGQELDVKVARSGNMFIIVTDEVPAITNVTSKQIEYTTYLFGLGAILTAKAPVERPSDLVYDAKLNGGTEELITRYRETIHPNGFTFAMTTLPISPTDEQLGAKENWKLVMNPKNIAIAKIVTN